MPASTAGSILIVAVVSAALWLLSGWYTVGPNEIGLNKVFGAYTGKTTPGLNYNWPFPIGSVTKLGVTDRNATNVGFTTRPDYTHANATTQIDVPGGEPDADLRREHRRREVRRDLADRSLAARGLRLQRRQRRATR